MLSVCSDRNRRQSFQFRVRSFDLPHNPVLKSLSYQDCIFFSICLISMLQACLPVFCPQDAKAEDKGQVPVLKTDKATIEHRKSRHRIVPAFKIHHRRGRLFCHRQNRINAAFFLYRGSHRGSQMPNDREQH